MAKLVRREAKGQEISSLLTPREIEVVIGEMREAELMRSVDAGPVCELLGLPEDTPLSEIASAAPPPWDDVLDEHRDADLAQREALLRDKDLLGIRAHLAATGRDTPAVTVKLVVEGEEESGSPTLTALLNEHRDALTKATQELSRLSRSNSAMLEASYRAVQETLDRFNHTSQDSTTYTATGARAGGSGRHLFDQKS